jgi:hypothetical protein
MNMYGARELDRRQSDGIDVALLWHPETDHVSVYVANTATEEEFELVVDPDLALDVFHHPYAHAAFRGVDFGIKEPVLA